MDESNKRDTHCELDLPENGDEGKKEEFNTLENQYLEQQRESKKLTDSEGAEVTSTPGDLEKLLEQKELELRQKHDSWLRALAEFENYKKRMAHEKANILKFGNESLMRELLPVIDNLELSLEHARKAKNVDTVIEGVEMVRKEFLRRLGKFGLRVISTEAGEKFDPAKHESVSHRETSEYPEGTVIEELQQGYFIHDRLLRAAQVTVAKSPPPPENESLISEEKAET